MKTQLLSKRDGDSLEVHKASSNITMSSEAEVGASQMVVNGLPTNQERHNRATAAQLPTRAVSAVKIHPVKRVETYPNTLLATETDPSKISVGKGSVTMRITSGNVEAQDTGTPPNQEPQQSTSVELPSSETDGWMPPSPGDTNGDVTSPSLAAKGFRSVRPNLPTDYKTQLQVPKIYSLGLVNVRKAICKMTVVLDRAIKSMTICIYKRH
ncbi:sorbin and SH3 domain-containing protein 1-like isoform X2 [Scyliorhinus canicula]|uniref:sorbin and SH3 domain-containing protein 1-like isoform X2 n=1 Tax=Scyliorhinus canicula TaxID=7830 RepID=UPI0018F619B3|nr:sorbin and SH3 domain-containing protein 1-like isoform X2 [Scyliorhinus canicula]XP_038639109.1 sorbin and SH3 domain-containing protein 1-like isoform X2 [Scyliorhinus canicula]